MADPLFSNRVAYLAAKNSKEGVADYYGVSTETVSNWIKGKNSPRSKRTRTSIIARGRRLSGKSAKVQTISGSVQVNDGSTVKAVETINADRRRLREDGLRLATNERQKRMIEREYKDLTEEEIRNLERQFNDLQKNRALGKQEASESAGQKIKREYDRLRNPLNVVEDDEEIVAPPVSRRIKREAYFIQKRGMRKKVYRGKRNGLYYLERSGRKVYVNKQNVRGERYAKKQ